MLNRWIGILALFGMLAANAELIFHDLVPVWLAGDPPRNEMASFQSGDQRRSQVGIFDSDGRSVGRAWTVAEAVGSMFHVRFWTILHPIALPNGLVTPEVRINTDLTYQKDTGLDMLDIKVYGLAPLTISLKGEFIPPDTFPCVWQVGDQQGRYILPAGATRALGDVIRPFDRLPGLYVGQSWRLKLFNPLSQLMPGLQGEEISLDTVLVRVTARERIEHRAALVDVHRVEADGVVAWVDTEGRVLRQLVELPLTGWLTLIDEPFDPYAFRRVSGYWQQLDVPPQSEPQQDPRREDRLAPDPAGHDT